MEVVSDTSPLNYLVLIGAIDLLPRLFSEILVPPAVVGELSQPGTPEIVRNWLATKPAWLRQQAPQNTRLVTNLDAGEAEAISLAREIGAGLLLLDERKARRVATELGLTVAGTLAVLETASRLGWIEFDDHISRLRKTTFRIHDRLIAEARTRLDTR